MLIYFNVGELRTKVKTNFFLMLNKTPNHEEIRRVKAQFH